MVPYQYQYATLDIYAITLGQYTRRYMSTQLAMVLYETTAVTIALQFPLDRAERAQSLPGALALGTYCSTFYLAPRWSC